MNPAELLHQGLSDMSLALPDSAIDKLLHYLALLHKWNRVYNLTAIRDAQQMVASHLLDSLSILPHLPPGRQLDVGAGGGMPGIIVAIARPEQQLVLLDTNGKKVRFLCQAIHELGLTNVEAVQARIEHWQAPAFDLISCRAFSSLKDFVDGSRHLLAPQGAWYAMKGQYPAEELAQLEPMSIQVVPLQVPQIEAKRHLIRLALQ